jgi:hypothetical protein
VTGFIIHVHKCALDVWQNLDLILELLTEIVCLPERGIPVHDNVDFDKVVLEQTTVSSARTIDGESALTGPLW